MMFDSDYTIDPSLMKKLLFPDKPKIRITNEALEAASFLLKRFIIEARYRASVEAEFDTDNESIDQNKRRAEDDDDEAKSSKKRKLSDTSSNGRELGDSSSDSEDHDDPILIRAKHILKISAEMMIDFA